ncbi:LysR substrate-binding domain-containing protein [Sulfitobacter sp. W074]|uniref:LysR substrate-binding domain-containing protein n=1 Tax=Sulfitobacter sp. W074 TaxID=2867026 RepID=UPI0021A47080|nr:LysR substrate-binding domain-containing protein [Sulfitobacter sp. W074]UWR38429.1 LysR family transcriptional regulator [Sulfitobacter sp. W074]
MMSRFIPSLSALTAFEAAATYRSFTRAAENLGMTQSGVSRQVSQLEKHLGVKVFERIGPRLVLTDAGRKYVLEVTRILNDLEETSIDIVRGGSVRGTLKIGVQDSLASRWIVPKIQTFITRFPEINFTVVPISNEFDADWQDVDVAVLRGRGAWDDAHAYHLLSETVAVVASPSLIPIGHTVSPSSYASYPLIQNAHRPDSWLRWIEAKELNRVDTISGPRFAQTSMVIEAARAGVGLAVVPSLMIEDHIASGSLHMPMGGAIASGLSYFVVYPLKLGVSKPVLDFRDWIQSVARKEIRHNSE